MFHDVMSLCVCFFCRTEVIIYLVERSPNGTSKRIPATTLFSYLEQANIKAQLTQIGVVMSATRAELSPAQLKQLLQNAPAGRLGRTPVSLSPSGFNRGEICDGFVSAGVDPIIWEQAKVDNPEPER